MLFERRDPAWFAQSLRRAEIAGEFKILGAVPEFLVYPFEVIAINGATSGSQHRRPVTSDGVQQVNFLALAFSQRLWLVV